MPKNEPNAAAIAFFLALFSEELAEKDQESMKSWLVQRVKQTRRAADLEATTHDN